MNESPALKLVLTSVLGFTTKRTAFINAYAHPLILDVKENTQELTVFQSFKPAINDLKAIGCMPDTLHGQFDRILMIPSKDKAQSLAWMALAFNHLVDGGKVSMACENQYGAKSYELALKKLAGTASSTSKSKCRLLSAKKTSALDVALQQSWFEDAKPMRLQTHGLWTQAGLFSWKTADVGSQLLLEHLPLLEGEGMDLCCGYGLLSIHVLMVSQNIKRLHMVDAEDLALDCAKKNIEGLRQITHDKTSYHHLDAAVETLPKHLDWIVCNPPFHTGQTRDVELGKTIVTRACESLKYNGQLYMVANRQLPYEKILREHLREVDVIAVGKGFKVLRGKK